MPTNTKIPNTTHPKNFLQSIPLPKDFSDPITIPEDLAPSFASYEPTCDSLKLKKTLTTLHLQTTSLSHATLALEKLLALTDSHKPEVARRACMSILKLAHLTNTPNLIPDEELFPKETPPDPFPPPEPHRPKPKTPPVTPTPPPPSPPTYTPTSTFTLPTPPPPSPPPSPPSQKPRDQIPGFASLLQSTLLLLLLLTLYLKQPTPAANPLALTPTNYQLPFTNDPAPPSPHHSEFTTLNSEFNPPPPSPAIITSMSENDPTPTPDAEVLDELLAAYQPLPMVPSLDDEPSSPSFDDDPIIEERSDVVSPPRPTEPPSIRLPRLREKAKSLPTSPGVYLMKDTRGVVIYVGKSRNLRDRVGSYFVPSTDLGAYGKQLLLEFVHDFDTLAADSEVEALLVENRLIKDIQPRFNARLLDDKTYPYLEITTRDDYPGVFITRQPSSTGTKLYGPFTSSSALKDSIQHLQRVFKFRTCHLDILEADPRKKFFRPCLLYAIRQCTAPCADKISKDAYRQDIDRLKRFLDSKGNGGGAEVVREMTADMESASKLLDFEKAATLRDQLKALRQLSERSRLSPDKAIQSEVFFQDHRSGLKSLQDLLELPEPIRSIEGIDIAHFQGEATAGSLVCFIDGRPFKNGYRRFRIKTVTGVDDYKSIQEVVSRRYRDAGTHQELYPDIILIDGGLGQLHAAQDAFNQMDVKPPMVISLAKREEEIYIQARSAPIKLSRTNAALKLLQHIRDEAHRFGQSYHHLLISKKRFESEINAGKRPPKGPRKRKQNPTVPATERAAATGEMKILTTDQIKEKSRELGAIASSNEITPSAPAPPPLTQIPPTQKTSSADS